MNEEENVILIGGKDHSTGWEVLASDFHPNFKGGIAVLGDEWNFFSQSAHGDVVDNFRSVGVFLSELGSLW